MTRHSKKSVEAYFKEVGEKIIKFCESDTNPNFKDTLGYTHSYLALEVI